MNLLLVLGSAWDWIFPSMMAMVMSPFLHGFLLGSRLKAMALFLDAFAMVLEKLLTSFLVLILNASVAFEKLLTLLLLSLFPMLMSMRLFLLVAWLIGAIAVNCPCSRLTRLLMLLLEIMELVILILSFPQLGRLNVGAMLILVANLTSLLLLTRAILRVGRLSG